MLLQHRNGARVPALGFGTFRLTGRTATTITTHAIETGYRHIDTAQMYGNEAEVGQALKQASVPRDQLWLTTKIWVDDFGEGDLQRAAEASVRALGTEPDLLLLHWPSRQVPMEESIRALNDAAQRGFTREIGISNFTTRQIEQACALSERPLISLQVEYHPFLDQTLVLEAARAHDLLITAYSPLAQGKVYNDPVLKRIGEAHGKTPGQVALRWILQQEVAAIPRSSKKANVETNFAVLDFALSDDEMTAISSLGSRDGRLVSPAGIAPDWD